MRLQINVGDDLVKRIDALAHSIGTSRSAFCSMILGQGVVSYEKSFEAINQLPPELVDVIKKKLDSK